MLTERQQDVFRAIVAHVEQHKRGPTLTALCKAIGTKSQGSMTKHVEALEAAELVDRNRGLRGEILPRSHCPCCGRKL